MDETAAKHTKASVPTERPGLVTQQSNNTPLAIVESPHEELEGLIPGTSDDQEMWSMPNDDPDHVGLPRINVDQHHKRAQRSITIRLEKLERSGRYKLNIDDPELRVLLKQGLERSKTGEVKKRRSRFSDLVFTQQFTAFDRQNPSSSGSIFHGFFSLFW